MRSNAPGQLLGYVYQFPRALFHLLKGEKGDIVCVEVLGDVATRRADGEVKAEEDKSSTIGNPLTDRSVNLWKTFANWIGAIKSGELDVKKTSFVLCCNQPCRHGIVNDFNIAKTSQEVRVAIQKAKDGLVDITKDHDIWEHYNYSVNQNENLLSALIERFELQTTSGAGYDEVRRELRRMLFPENQIDFLVDELGGWLQRTIVEKIASNQQALISWEEYARQSKVLFERVRLKELIDFASLYPPKKDEIQHHAEFRPQYLRQLEKINIPEDDILDAVIDYLRAKINRDRWIDAEIIDFSTASDFQTKLESFWKEARKRIEITQKQLTEEERGQLLLCECKSRQETIRGIQPPPSTIAGTYHALADKPVLGWHPGWKTMFSPEGDE